MTVGEATGHGLTPRPVRSQGVILKRIGFIKRLGITLSVVGTLVRGKTRRGKFIAGGDIRQSRQAQDEKGYKQYAKVVGSKMEGNQHVKEGQ